ncbi:MAG: arylsulfatase [Verrucomicrobia bacterium]|nr:arylsulfatase [Verrucomicrobiota bacterium]MDA1066473.1 arylsulfatase [Verrucomicrobiota bacterium]
MKTQIFCLLLLLGFPVCTFAADSRPIRQASDFAQELRRDTQDKPNIILVLTDDQDFYDLGFHGNPEVDTPNIDKFASDSLEMGRFYVSPLCSPTRASIMTGRSHQRTGILHTSRGATRLADDETTIAEILSTAGYRTGVFGKWHLGDNYPSRPQDQGFEETFYHKSGGIGQPPDEDGSYWKPVVYHNGEREVHDRYCTDLFFDKAIEYIQREDHRPYFVYLPTNVPHGPNDVDQEYYQPFMDKGVNEQTARIYGMVKNLDENFGRLMEELERSGDKENTLVIFMSDNGGVKRVGFQGDFRGHKGDIYDGGIRAPFFVRWPTGISSKQKLNTIAAHYDLLPTFAALAGAILPKGLELDGRNILPLWTKGTVGELKERTIVIQFVKSIEQALYKCASIINQDYKLVLNPESAFDSSFVANRDAIELALYDIANDPGESKDIAVKHPKVVEKLLSDYEAWYSSVNASRNMQPGRIHIDPTKEDPVHLSRYQEGYHWHHDSLPEGWMLNVIKEGIYRLHITDSNKYPFTLTDFWKEHPEATVSVLWKHNKRHIPIEPGAAYIDIHLDSGIGRLDVYFNMIVDRKVVKNWNGDITIEYLPYEIP